MKRLLHVFLFLSVLCIACNAACAQEAQNIFDKCAVQVSEGSADRVTDGSISTGWVPSGANPELMIRLPESIESIAENAFDGCANLSFAAESEYAAAYAAEHGINCITNK